MKEPLSALRAALGDPDRRVRSQAARAIGYLGPEAAEAAPDLVRLMARGADAKEALHALGEIGEAAVPHILEFLDGEKELRLAAEEALRIINPGGR